MLASVGLFVLVGTTAVVDVTPAGESHFVVKVEAPRMGQRVQGHPDEFLAPEDVRILRAATEAEPVLFYSNPIHRHRSLDPLRFAADDHRGAY